MKQLMTKWGKQVDKECVLQEYPRPLMVRDNFMNLNGSWNYLFADSAQKVKVDQGEIVVPFSPECVLSGVGRQLKPDEYLWYQRTFELNQNLINRHVILHFGAVDQGCQVFVNGKSMGRHTGGYLPFEMDITRAVKAGENEIRVLVKDFSETSYHARGKQRIERGGMFYTAQSGIWQTVWLEIVPCHYIETVICTPEFDEQTVELTVAATEDLPFLVSVFEPVPGEAYASGELIASTEGMSNQSCRIAIPKIKAWTPQEPYLYHMTIKMGDDQVESYFAMRTFTLEKDENQIPRLCLNHVPYFQKGVLDQGYWPDGLYTAPSDEALVFDIQSMKDMGFNMMRKHAKIECDRWYYHCDRLGMIVWQDMVNGGTQYKHWYVTYMATLLSKNKIKVKDTYTKLLSRKEKAGRLEFVVEMKETIRRLYSHPCIATWVIFNEGWGQFQTAEMTEIVRKLDPGRMIDQASGWFDQGGGDMQSLHNYFFRFEMKAEKERATVLSEFGGYSHAVAGHTACEKTYGYGAEKTTDSLNATYQRRQKEVEDAISQGLCATVYTQVSDVEEEINGIFTYDREIQKIRGLK
ncbi:MAG: glycoside hydrolase family 2 TIM barrel-domain containing protein [Hespellia sp.]|nr:glycoside hydrolase family 2 TIM barrel-domain containing protein [Hespellia sp.]